MRWLNVAAVLLGFAPSVSAAPDIRFPVAPVPAPSPAPVADLSTLSGEQLYVIDSDAPLIVLASPAGLVRVTEDTGPLKIRGRFVDGGGKVETRTFKGKHLFTVEAVGTGRVELLVVPVGATKEADVIRKTLDVDAQNPIPPPKPVPPKPEPPKPDPPAPAPDAALVAALKVALAKDIAASNGTKAKAADLAVVFDSGASLLDLNDPAIAPKTVGELYTKMVLASVAKGIPRPPYLKETRGVIDANLPLLNGTTELTPALKADFQTKYRAVAAALTEASK